MYMMFLLLKAERNWEVILCFDDLSCEINDIFQSASIMMEVFCLKEGSYNAGVKPTLDYI